MGGIDLKTYQDADYRSIYTSRPFDVPTLGECRLVIFVEDMAEYGDVPPAGQWWTALFLIAPDFAGDATIQDSLDFIGWAGERRSPNKEDMAVALAEAGYRLVLWERETSDWEADLAAAKQEAYKLQRNSNPAQLCRLLPAVTFGETGYEHLGGKKKTVTA